MSVDPNSPQPFMDHLDELLARVRKCFIYVIIGCVVGYSSAEFLISLMTAPLTNIPYLPTGAVAPKIIVTAPFERFWVYLRLAFLGGIFVSVPAVAYEISKFIGPGLKEHEKKRIVYLTGSIYLTFLVGFFIGYRWILPMVLSAIVRFGQDSDIANTWSLSVYVSSSLGVLFATALLIQLPVVMTHLSSWGWVKASTWAKSRRHAIVLNAVVSGILSPPDVQSMIVMMIPVQLLYEGGIVLARVAEWVINDKSLEKK